MEKIETIKNIKTPYYILEEEKLERNLKVLDRIQKEAGIKILLSLKAFALWKAFPIIKKYLYGCSASGLHEARLAHEEFGKQIHTYSPAFSDEDFPKILRVSDHIIFNSFEQWIKFKKEAKEKKCGIRINPEISFSPKDIYSPCKKHSRLGVTLSEFKPELLQGITGFHIHTLCEQNADSFEKVLIEFERKFGHYFKKLEWINFGGGLLLTQNDFDLDKFCFVLKEFKKRHPHLEIFLEPGEAVGWEAGYLISQVLDIVKNEIEIAILDTSVAAHMPDVLEMPYRPEALNAGVKNEFKYNYQLAGNTCLSGDIIGEYSFEKPLNVGDKIIFKDMIHYTIVKNNTFNGIKLPSIAVLKKYGEIKLVKEFRFEDYKNRNS